MSGSQVVNQRKSFIRRSMETASKAKDRITNIKKQMEGFEVASLGAKAAGEEGVSREYYSGKVRSPGR